MALVFRDDDAGYLAWIEANPDGYVINTRRQIDANYLVFTVRHAGQLGTIHAWTPGPAVSRNAATKRYAMRPSSICRDMYNFY